MSRGYTQRAEPPLEGVAATILMKRDMQGFIIDRTKSPEFSGKIDFVLFPVQKGKVFKNIDMRKYEVL